MEGRLYVYSSFFFFFLLINISAANAWGAYPYGAAATPEAWAAYAQVC